MGCARLRRMAIDVVLLDLDGVIRHFDPEHRRAIEVAHGLPEGETARVAFEPELIDSVTTGRITRAAWVDEVGRRLGDAEAATAWLAERGAVDPEMLSEIDRLRALGLTVAILTNGTDTIPDEMIELGIDIRVDAVFNSAEIGAAKPDPRAFRHVCDELRVAAGTVFFTDDSPHKLAGAVELGMTARHFTGVDTFRDHLAQVGIPADLTPDGVTSTYERQAARFDRDRSRALHEVGWLERFVGLLPGDGRVLDLGCGTGEPIGRWLAERGLRVTGIDASAAMLAIARERAPDGDWRQLDLRRLDLGERFDGIVAWDSIFHLTPADQIDVVGRIARHLRPRGPLLMNVGPSAGVLSGRVGDETVYHASLAPEHYRELLAAEGVEILDFVPEDPTCGNRSVMLARSTRPDRE